MKKRILIFICLLNICGIYLFTSSILTCQAKECVSYTCESENDIQQRAEILGWRYKIVDGKLYKRLFNYTSQQWVGSWKPC